MNCESLRYTVSASTTVPSLDNNRVSRSRHDQLPVSEFARFCDPLSNFVIKTASRDAVCTRRFAENLAGSRLL